VGILRHRDGSVHVHSLPDGRLRLVVQPDDHALYIHRRACVTSYGLELIEKLLEVKGLGWLCDEILRDEDPGYVSRTLRFAVLPYVDETQLTGRRILDFGCGSGASTAILGRWLADTEIVGVDLDPELLAIARLRAEHYELRDVSFRRSPAGDRLPDGLGTFGAVFLSAVYEHLLPDERGSLLGKLWEALEPGGVLFLSETPHRLWPVESHTTGLPLLNYAPAPLALRLARRLSPRVAADATWPELLRDGVRGGTPREVLDDLRRAGSGAPVLLRPHRLGLRSEADVWFAKGRPTRARRLVRSALEAVNRATEAGLVPYVSLAVRKAG